MGKIKGKKYKVFVYVLVDPRYNTIRYVGVTVDMRERLGAHLRDTKSCHRVHWIQSVLQDGCKPIMRLIDETNETEWAERERYWIKYYKSIGCNLTNQTAGGDGLLDASPETRAKISAARKGKPLSLAHRVKIALGGTGRHPTEETRAKLSKVQKGRVMPQSQRDNLSVARMGQTRSDESRAKQSATVTGEGNHGFGKPRPQELRDRLSEMEKERYANLSEEEKQKQRDSHKGIKRSDEAKLKTSNTLRMKFALKGFMGWIKSINEGGR